MDVTLSFHQTRVIGSLLEKESTIPDQYPLSLNTLVNACNQTSNRDPVLSLTEKQVQEALDGLMKERLVSQEQSSRVSKYRHRFCNTEFSSLQLTAQQRAVICVLFLRGPQTPGLIRSRTSRLAEFVDVNEVGKVLQDMADKEMVIQLPREPGKRECRYAHLFSGEVDVAPTSDLDAVDPTKIQELEDTVIALKAEISRLNKELGK